MRLVSSVGTMDRMRLVSSAAATWPVRGAIHCM
jgi:hypothetical protein